MILFEALSVEMWFVLGLLVLVIGLFVTETFRVDVVGIIILSVLGLSTAFFPLLGLLPPIDSEKVFSGFASNAVISIISVMIIGSALDKTGTLLKLANLILKSAGRTEKRLIPFLAGTVGVISGFMQNVGAVALFLPVASKISSKSGISLSKLLMPMSYCAIMGGCLTMVGASALILTNDLVTAGGYETFGLFDVTLVGICLLASGILYFVFVGRFLLPTRNEDSLELTSGEGALQYFEDTYGLKGEIIEVFVPDHSLLVGKTIMEIEGDAEFENPFIFGIHYQGERIIEPIARQVIEGKMTLALFGTAEQIKNFLKRYKYAEVRPALEIFADVLDETQAGIVEIVIPPSSKFIGKTPFENNFRSKYQLNAVTLYREAAKFIRGNSQLPALNAGDTLLVHAKWSVLSNLSQSNRDFFVLSDFPKEILREAKVRIALAILAATFLLAFMVDIRLSFALLSGALAMILTRVITIDEAYKSVSWSTVFLVAGLIALGGAIGDSGLAKAVSQYIITLAGTDLSLLWWQVILILLTTVFTLFISSVGGVVLLVPLAMTLAVDLGFDPRMFAVVVGLAAANTFILPTHHANALVITPGGYSVRDFMRVGVGMTIVFTLTLLLVVNLLF